MDVLPPQSEAAYSNRSISLDLYLISAPWRRTAILEESLRRADLRAAWPRSPRSRQDGNKPGARAATARFSSETESESDVQQQIVRSDQRGVTHPTRGAAAAPP